ncbi:MAG: hypothetical protein K6G17_03995 [Oscillospiraceae bacterium]|nr:hypothetical protein [Oscillospiraceae bacterium]
MKKTLSLLLCAALLLTLLAACGSAPAASSGGSEFRLQGEELRVEADTADNARVFYEIFVGSFSDSDGDGVGDLRGIIKRMDYLNDGDANSGLSLGVEGLWLSPIFLSPSYHKYDVTDYYTVDPAFGTEADLRELVELCHERNVKLILDLVINHSGDRNQWFLSFAEAHRQGDTDSPFYDFYSWCGPGREARPGCRYAAISGSGDSYECNFDTSMPEFNYDDPAVRQAVLELAEYYLDLGVDGFRFDAAKYVYYGDNARSAAFWDWYLAELRAYKPDIYTVAEVWDDDYVTDVYYSATNCFNFTVSQAEGLIASAVKGGGAGDYTAYVEAYLDGIRDKNPDAMMIPFIANHDTDRAAGYLGVDNGQMKLAANLYILSSGSPFLYYGEELGMRGSRGGEPTDANRRLAMLWGDGDTVKDPVGSSYRQQTGRSAAEQTADADSLYNYYKRLILIRKANPAIARGDYTAWASDDGRLGGFYASWQGETVMVIHNTSLSPASVDLAELGVTELRAFIGVNEASVDGAKLTLGAQTSAVLR